MIDKSEFLGENFSSANYRLQRRIMFNLIQQLKQDICFRCERRIESYEDFSIDHKEFWLGINIKLFWDLDNIAFSHFNCNAKVNRQSIIPRIRKVVAGKIKCSHCKEFKAVQNFSKGNKYGFQSECRPCRSVLRRRAREA